MDIAALVLAIVAVVLAAMGLTQSRLNRKHFLRYISRQSPLERKVGQLVSEREYQTGRVSDAEDVDEQTEPSQRVLAVIINPVKDQATTVENLLTSTAPKYGFDNVLVLHTTEEDPGKQMALDALAAQAELVIAAGGDGTVRMVAEELAGTGVPMGIVPLGTGNLLARNLDFQLDNVIAHTRGIFTGWHRRVDTMMLHLKMKDGSTQTRRSLVIAGVGADAMMIQDTRDELKAIAGWLAYGEAGLKQLSGKRTKISVSVDDRNCIQRRVRSVMFANVGQLQAGMNFVPDAIIDDGLLDLVVLSPSGSLGWLSVAKQTLTGRPGKAQAIEYLQGKKIEFQVTDGSAMPAQLDGDVIGEVSALTAEVDPRSLLVVIPH